MIQKPEALLGEGERQAAIAGQRQERPGGRGQTGTAVLGHKGGQSFNPGSLKQGAQREFDGKGFAQAREQLGGQQGVAAEVEEVVRDAHPLELEHLGPKAGEQLFDRIARGQVVVSCGQLWRRQGAPINFAVGRQRQTVEGDEGAGQHVVGQTLPQVSAQLRVAQGVLCAGYQISHQAALAGLVGAGQNHRLAHGGVSGQDCLNLTQLDAEASDLYLLIAAAEKLKLDLR